MIFIPLNSLTAVNSRPVSTIGDLDTLPFVLSGIIELIQNERLDAFSQSSRDANWGQGKKNSLLLKKIISPSLPMNGNCTITTTKKCYWIVVIDI